MNPKPVFAFLLLSLAACGGGDPEPEPAQPKVDPSLYMPKELPELPKT